MNILVSYLTPSGASDRAVVLGAPSRFAAASLVITSLHSDTIIDTDIACSSDLTGAEVLRWCPPPMMPPVGWRRVAA